MCYISRCRKDVRIKVLIEEVKMNGAKLEMISRASTRINHKLFGVTSAVDDDPLSK